MAKTEEDFFNVANDIKKINGLEAGNYMVSQKQELFASDKGAVIDAAAKFIENKEKLSEDLKKLINDFGIDNNDIFKRVLARQINAVLGK